MGHLGHIPEFLSERDARPAREQFDLAYRHGGGWSPMKEWERAGQGTNYSIKYPGDEAMNPLAITRLREETICFYEHSWVGIFQPDGKFEISRMD